MKSSKTTILLSPFSLLTALLVLSASADAQTNQTEVSAPGKSVSKESSNFEKSKEFLPGEEVVTPTGKKMKVWSTKGPVKVSPPPEPFETREEKGLPEGTSVYIDAAEILRQRENKRSEAEKRGNDKKEADSFDLRKDQ